MADAVERRARIWRDVVVAGPWFGGGAVVTAIAYASAEPGGRFVVTSGAIVYGVFRAGRGLYRLVSSA